MNAWAFKGERHKKVPEIQTEGDFNLKEYAKPKPKEPIKFLPDGSVEFYPSYISKKKVYEDLKDKQEADLGRPLTEEEEQEIWQIIKEAKSNHIDIGPLKYSCKLNLQQQYRSAAHTLLKCLGFYSPHWLCDDITSKVREFARYDKGSWEEFAVVVEQHSSWAKKALPKLGVHHNSVEIYWCRSLEKVMGVVTILGRIKRAVIIAEGYRGSDGILYVFENTFRSKKLHPCFVEFNSELPSVTRLEIQHYPPNIEYFKQELCQLLENSQLGALTAWLFNNMEKIAKEKTPITPSFLQEYEKLVVEFSLGMKKFFGVSAEPAEICSKLAEYGFSDLKQYHLGKICKDDAEVRTILETACTKVYQELVNQIV